MASDTLAERIRQHYSAEMAEVELDATGAAHAILHQVSITLMSSADLNLTLDGHHLKADLHPAAHARLLNSITDIIRTKLSIQRCAGERAALSSNATSRSFLHQ